MPCNTRFVTFSMTIFEMHPHKLKCSYEHETVTIKQTIRENQICCVIRNAMKISALNEQITGIDPVTNHYSKPNDTKELKCLRSLSGEVKYFPQGIENIFPKLMFLTAENQGLLEITQHNLKVFPNLVFLDLQKNLIKHLAKGLFEFNNELHTIDLTGNNIRIIDKNVFEVLPNLFSLTLTDNLCINKDGTGRNEIIKFLDIIKVECAPKNATRIQEVKRKISFNWRKHFWTILICGTISLVLLFYGIAKICFNGKITPEIQ